MEYQTLLVALDVFSDFEPVIRRAIALSDTPHRLHLLYVAYPQTNIEPYGLFLERDFTNDICDQARSKLSEIAEHHHIPKSHVHVSIGTPADEIHHLAEQLNADAIVIGTHGQSGVRLLLGSTATAVLHGAKSDVIAVRV